MIAPGWDVGYFYEIWGSLLSGGIFISYRREDSAGYAGRIYDRLSSVLDRQKVFFDVDNIPPGLDFVKILSDRVGACDALVAIIGKEWLSVKDEDNQRRLDDPNDFVRIEIEAALARDVPVIPVFVDGARMPRHETLPNGLKPLVRRQGIEISHTRFDSDTERLTKALGFIDDEQRKRVAAEAEQIATEELKQQRAAETSRIAAEEHRQREAAETGRIAEEERKNREAAEAERIAAKDIKPQEAAEAELIAATERGRLKAADPTSRIRSANWPTLAYTACAVAGAVAVLFWEANHTHKDGTVTPEAQSPRKNAENDPLVMECYRLLTFQACEAAIAKYPTLPQVQYDLGVFYDNGQGVSQDYTQARVWYQKAADQGNADAQNNLGVLYEKGRGVTQDYAQAKAWYQMAADQGSARGQASLGWLYEMGYGVTQDYVQAKTWNQMAADQGNATAQSNLGVIYQNGYGVSQDYAQARAWYQKAADQGYAAAQSNLGVIYQNGYGVPKDYAQARAWYQKAADQGNAPAQSNLGGMYQNGYGVPKDYAQASTWYQKAADQGNTDAQRNLGWLYEKGYGVPKDYTKAREWNEKALAAGNTKAWLGISWTSLLLHDFPRALEAAERYHKLEPEKLIIETNHAHALMFLNRTSEAKTLYLSHKNEPIPELNNKTWREAVLQDFVDLREAGLNNSLMKIIENVFAQP